MNCLQTNRFQVCFFIDLRHIINNGTTNISEIEPCTSQIMMPSGGISNILQMKIM